MPHDPFALSLTRLDQAAPYIKVKPWTLEKLRHCNHPWQSNLHIVMDDGSHGFYDAYRIQHCDPFQGPYKGGVRYHHEVDMSEVSSLAFGMTMKCSLMGQDFGGAKGGIAVNPSKLSLRELESLSRAYIRAFGDVIGPERDVPAPDVGTSPMIMAWFADEWTEFIRRHQPGIVTGKPIVVGGIEGRDTSTAQGGLYVLMEHLRRQGKTIEGMRIAVQGNGNAGGHFARLAARMGAILVGITDDEGGIANPDGIDVLKDLPAWMEQNRGKVAGFHGSTPIDNDQLFALPCDIMVPAALGNQLTVPRAQRLLAKIVVELANFPTPPDADAILNARGIEVIADSLANGGGVVGSGFEWEVNMNKRKFKRGEFQTELSEVMLTAYDKVTEAVARFGVSYRVGCNIVAVERVCLALEANGVK